MSRTKTKGKNKTRRLLKEFKMLEEDDTSNVSAILVDDNIYHWKATMIGPLDTVYEGGIFHLDIHIPKEYPHLPPKIKFITKVYHPNINSSGHICLDILKESKWSAAQTMRTLLISLMSLLTDPNPDDPLVGAIAKEYTSDRKQFNKKARQLVQEELKKQEEESKNEFENKKK